MTSTDNEKKSIFQDASDAGKGDRPRPGISPKRWGERWEKIFRNKEEMAREESGSIHISKNERREYNKE